MSEKPYELNGNQVGMSLRAFKAKNRPTPRCDRDSTGLVRCRPAYASTDEGPISTVASVRTLRLFYSFVDDRLFKITFDCEFAFTKDVHTYLVAKYGAPNNEQERNWTWDNGVSAIHLTQGNKKDSTNLTILHHELSEIAAARIAQADF
jgi:hypothetical protein